MAMRFAIANEDSPVLDFQDARIGDGDSEDIGGKVLEACFAGTDGLGVNVPVDLPEFRGDFIEEASFHHFISELGFKDDGERSYREIEINPRGVPEAIGGGEGTAWDDVMDMGVILQGSSPSMKDSEESGKITTDVMFIQGEFLHRFG